MSGASASLPNLQRASNAAANVQSGLNGFLRVAGGLADGSADSPLHALGQALGGLEQVLEIDLSGLSERLPATLTNIEQALPADALRFVEDLKAHYQEVVGFLNASELLRQIRPGTTLQETALGLIDDLLELLGSRLDTLGASLLDAATLERVRRALAALDDLAAGNPLSADELLDFLGENLLGVAPELLQPARHHLTGALALLEPLTAAALATTTAPASAAAALAWRQLGQSLHDFDADDAAAYGVVQGELDALRAAHEAAFVALEEVLQDLSAVLASAQWETLFTAYAEVLRAIPLPAPATLDDAVEALAGALEMLLARLTMSLSPADLAAQVARLSSALHDMFAASPLAQVRQILIDFISQVRQRIEAVPVAAVETAVHAMLQTVRQQIDELGIGEVRSRINQAFAQANDFVDQRLSDDLLDGVNDALASALAQLQNVPIAELGQELANAVGEAGQVVADLQRQMAAGLDEIRTLLASLDGIDFRPLADEVIDEIDALTAKLAAIKPEALSDGERIALQAGLSLLRAVDLEGMIEGELKTGFASVENELAQAVRSVLDAWLEFRRRIGGLDGSALAAPVNSLLDQVGERVLALNGSLVVAPLEELLAQLLAKAQALSPAALLEPLEQPYARVLQTIERANPAVWVEPLRVLHGEINRLIDLIDITPLLTALAEKERQVFAQLRQQLVGALDAVDLPPPLDAFYAQMKALVVGLSDAVFSDPELALRQVNLAMADSLRPSALFAPLDQAFDRLLAALEALPEDDIVAALEALRQGLGAALPALDPARLIATLRAGLEAKLALSSADAAAKASLLARFDLTLAPLDLALAGGRLQRVHSAHTSALAALRRRINALDSAPAEGEFQRLNSALTRLLPDFLRQSTALEAADVRAALATLRPSTKARRIDLAYERFLAQLAPLQGALETAVNGFFGELRQAALALHPDDLKSALAEVYASVRSKLAVLDPDEVAAALRASVWDPLLEPLHALDPAALKPPLDALFRSLVDKIGASGRRLLQQIRQAIDLFLGRLRQALSGVLATLKEKIGLILAGVEQLLGQIDQLVVDDLFERLLALLANLQISFEQQLERVHHQFDAMLAAIPLSGSAQVSIG
ncbi:hypothetical protein [Accumulibacter sp.]|uniref:hypothetical protein n=1 Tax=Accumulibacter sp. TaxID=2053492 RepID=UPI002C793182|nr:hypothetical protein [Accumulibacter sp.]HNB67809.1 hypothetical protein [Accumulibacter sp.]